MSIIFQWLFCTLLYVAGTSFLVRNGCPLIQRSLIDRAVPLYDPSASAIMTLIDSSQYILRNNCRNTHATNCGLWMEVLHNRV